MDGKMIDSNSGNDGSNREHLLSFQNHAAVAFRRYLEGTVRAWTRLRRFGTDRDGHGSDGGAGRDRGVRGIRLFRRTGRDRHDGSEGVDMIRLELGDLDAKVFVLARTPLLASMGRWVILSNSSSAVRNPAKKDRKCENADRDVHWQTTSSKARSQHASPDSALRAGRGRRACDDENTGG